MSELDTTVDVDTTDVELDTTTPDSSDEIQYEDAVKWKESLEKATSNYVLP